MLIGCLRCGVLVKPYVKANIISDFVRGDFLHLPRLRLGQQLADRVRFGDDCVRQAVVAALVRIGQLPVIETQRMKQRGVEIINADYIFHRLVAELIGGAMHVTFLETATREPE